MLWTIKEDLPILGHPDAIYPEQRKLVYGTYVCLFNFLRA